MKILNEDNVKKISTEDLFILREKIENLFKNSNFTLDELNLYNIINKELYSRVGFDIKKIRIREDLKKLINELDI